MAHPKIEAATLVSQFLVTNPLIMIKIHDAKNRLRIHLDEKILVRLKNFSF